MASSKLVKGWGINDADYTVRVKTAYYDSQGKRKFKEVWNCPFYAKWLSALERGVSEKYAIKKPSYADVTVNEEWKYFSKFKAWMETKNWKGLQLDKDILVKGNKIYSPETCCFVPSEVNNLIIFSNSARGEYPVGVTFHKRLKKYAANISLGGVIKHLGYFDEVSEAFNSYKIAKERYIKFVAEKYFGKKYISYLKGQEILNKYKMAWTNAEKKEQGKKAYLSHIKSQGNV